MARCPTPERMEANGRAAMEILRQFREERARENDKWAKENGYTCFEEYSKIKRERDWQYHLEYERQQDEKAAALGKTREQMALEDPQRFIPYGGSISPCSCEGKQASINLPYKPFHLTIVIDHLAPLFCPASLIDYRSQDHPDFMDFLAMRKGARIQDLRINTDDRSKRLDPEQLANHWAVESSPSDAFNIPFWARGDPVTKQMLSSRSPSSPQLNRTARPRGDSITPASSNFGLSESVTRTTPSGKQQYNNQYPSPYRCNMLSPPSNEPLYDVSAQKQPSTLLPPASQDLRPRSKSKRASKLLQRGSAKKVGSSAAASKIEKRRTLRPGPATRSRHIGHFYELDLTTGVVATRRRERCPR